MKNDLRRRVAIGFAVSLLCGAAAADRDGHDDRGTSAAQLRRFIDGQVGGIDKLTVPTNNASIPVPRNADGSVNPRFKTTEEKRFLGKMLFHDPVRTARDRKSVV